MNPPINQPIYGIGIDTGGTYTDAVLMDLRTNQVLRTSKCPTVHHDLKKGIVEALKEVVSVDESAQIRQIAFSTTLATNAIAEGHGAKVGLIVIGHVKPFDLPVVSVRYFDGGHDHTGKEVKPLEIERIVEAVTELKEEVDAYAIAAAMSIENPAHEQVVLKAIELVDPKPVFCSHQTSRKPGVKERAATAVLHARLMPVIKGFVERLEQLKTDLSPSVMVKMIRGDATAVDLDAAILRAADTVASGPAATAFFGARSVAARRALVVDVGGTTTDITLIEDGHPVISSNGSWIGQWETHINAVEMDTVGIGGDSLAWINRSGQITVGPNRVQPLATADGVPDPADWMGAECRNRCITLPKGILHSGTTEDPIIELLKHQGAASPAELMALLRLSEFSLERRLKELVFRRQVVETGFTPTDALHVLGRVQIGDLERAVAGARILARLRAQNIEPFCLEVVRLTQEKIARAILAHVFRKQTGKAMESVLFENEDDPLLSVSFKLNIPIVGIGAASRQLLPEVAENLQTQIIFPPHYDVGNALGAIMIAIAA